MSNENKTSDNQQDHAPLSGVNESFHANKFYKTTAGELEMTLRAGKNDDKIILHVKSSISRTEHSICLSEDDTKKFVDWIKTNFR